MKGTHTRHVGLSLQGGGRQAGRWVTFGLMVCLFALVSPGLAAAQPSPPAQPLEGPGGYGYVHQGVTTLGPYYPPWHPDEENYQYYIFEPADPTPEFAPVVLFIHGYQAYLPTAYANWIGQCAKDTHWCGSTTIPESPSQGDTPTM